jgi:hydroxyethylthiazole kinase
MNMKEHTAGMISRVRDISPLVHNITNYVVMNSSANILLAIGASPVMAHCRTEVAEMTGISGALVLNIGTIEESWLEAMLAAGHAANAKGIPVILDPVGSGATTFRTSSVKRILDECRVSVLRGNASEVFSLLGPGARTKGVDSLLSFTDSHVETTRQMAKDLGCIVAVSGETDCITDGERVFLVKNGHPLMTRVTGIGCGLSAVTAAFCAVSEADMTASVASAFGFYGICGEIAAKTANKPGSFEVAFIDALFSAGEREIGDMLQLNPAEFL